jgi:hydrogenase maturation protease
MKLLVAGIGNIFFGDDAFGCEVARELMKRSQPIGVKVEDYGIRGYDLAYALMEGTDAILIDAVPRGEAPGTLFLIEPNLTGLGGAAPPDGHTMTPVSVLQLVHSLGGRTGRLYLIGCEPAVLESENGDMGLSQAVKEAVPYAVAMTESLINDLFNDRNPIRSGLTGAAKGGELNVLL